MPTSSAQRSRQLAFDLPEPEGDDSQSQQFNIDSGDGRNEDTAMRTVLFDDFVKGARPIDPEMFKVAGRRNAAAVSDREHRALLDERQRLLDKKLSGEITRRESNRLEYVRWSLDRIEDARHGWSLDSLDASVARYESFLSDIRTFEGQLREAVKRKR